MDLIKFKKMFKCDKVRISKSMRRMFLIIGFKKQTKYKSDHWIDEKGKRVDFEYIEETVIASGNTKQELIKSAKEYKRLQNITTLDYLKEKLL